MLQATHYAKAIADRDAAVAERDEAIAERDFILTFLQDLGEALGQSERLSFVPTAKGVEVRSFYSSLADALAANVLLRDLRAMLSLTPRAGEAALPRRLAEVFANRFQA